MRFLKLSHRAPKASQGIRLPKNHHSPVNSMLQDVWKMVVRLLETRNTMKLETSIYHMIICIQVFSTRQKNGPRSTRINHCNYMSQEHSPLTDSWPKSWQPSWAPDFFHQLSTCTNDPRSDIISIVVVCTTQQMNANDMSFTHSTKIARYNVKCFGYNRWI